MAKRKIILYTAVSLDGFIAREDGSYDWLHDDDYAEGKEDYGYDKFLKNIDTILMGFNTYKDIMTQGEVFPYHRTQNYVFTRRKNIPDDPHVEFVSDEIVEFITELKNSQGKDIWLVGGGQINSILTKHKLVDEFILTYIPITLGKGIRIFHGESFDNRYKLNDAVVYPNGFVQLYLK
ncbi:dihydrofolate reductase family protein [Membranihabitans maritimus]|uniref:dihydrofolate reductase family protein n=1 Tax=Membranihabitans maritimus TaxID=2904244 RepID=UPI001F2236B7|nr:dihydrofolate reductase family protein [Membranihabitans maritimus]